MPDDGARRPWSACALLAAVAWDSARIPLGSPSVTSDRTSDAAEESAYDEEGPVNRLLIAASRQSDLCGCASRPTI